MLSEGSIVIRYLIVLGVGYVLGAKAGRRRYEQMASAYRTITSHPATRTMIDAGRRRIAHRVSPDPALATVTRIDAETMVIAPPHPKN